MNPQNPTPPSPVTAPHQFFTVGLPTKNPPPQLLLNKPNDDTIRGLPYHPIRESMRTNWG